MCFSHSKQGGKTWHEKMVCKVEFLAILIGHSQPKPVLGRAGWRLPCFPPRETLETCSLSF